MTSMTSFTSSLDLTTADIKGLCNLIIVINLINFILYNIIIHFANLKLRIEVYNKEIFNECTVLIKIENRYFLDSMYYDSGENDNDTKTC